MNGAPSLLRTCRRVRHPDDSRRAACRAEARMAARRLARGPGRLCLALGGLFVALTVSGLERSVAFAGMMAVLALALGLGRAKLDAGS